MQPQGEVGDATHVRQPVGQRVGFGQVRARAELALGASEHEHSHVGVARGGVERVGELGEHRGVDRILPWGAVHRHRDHTLAPLDRDGFIRPHAPDDNHIVGYNPFRQQRRRTSDYAILAAALVVVAVLLVWALVPR